MLCEMRMIGSPRFLTSRISSRTRRHSLTPSAAVGSSMMTTRLAKAAARATATPVPWPPQDVSTRCSLVLILLAPTSFMFSRAEEGVDQRRLAGAIGPNDGEDVAWEKVEVGVVQRSDPSVTLDKAASLEGRFEAHFDTLRIHWSRATATMIRTPMANSCQST